MGKLVPNPNGFHQHKDLQTFLDQVSDQLLWATLRRRRRAVPEPPRVAIRALYDLAEIEGAIWGGTRCPIGAPDECLNAAVAVLNNRGYALPQFTSLAEAIYSEQAGRDLTESETEGSA